MKKTITLTYPAGPERVAAMLADPDYQRKRVERADLSDASIDVAVRGRGFVSTISGSVPPERLPSAAKRFIRSAPSFKSYEGKHFFNFIGNALLRHTGNFQRIGDIPCCRAGGK